MSMRLDERNWIEQANCKGMDRSVFFPSTVRGIKDAKKVCSTCPVSAECLQYATDNALEYGVWGGLGESDRLKLARDARRAGL
jgi:WhiB family redox-sensing transcriptional regulator